MTGVPFSDPGQAPRKSARPRPRYREAFIVAQGYRRANDAAFMFLRSVAPWPAMSRLRKRGDLKAPRLFAYLVDCDGANAPGGDEGALEGARLWFTLRGRYEVATARGRRIGDPATVLLTHDREPYRLRHP